MSNKVTLIILFNMLYLPFAGKIYEYVFFKNIPTIGFIVGVSFLALYLVTFLIKKYSANFNFLETLPILIICLIWLVISIWELYVPTQATVRIDLLVIIPLISVLTPTCFAMWVNGIFKKS